ncbi:MAG TPA: hypothetical protein VJ484_00735 [Lysobacter sp.]|nr:hypothetical protein [Lysobacter sp.]
MRNTGAQVKALYAAEELVGRQVGGVINFPPKQVGPFVSEFLLTAFHRRWRCDHHGRAFGT